MERFRPDGGTVTIALSTLGDQALLNRKSRSEWWLTGAALEVDPAGVWGADHRPRRIGGTPDNYPSLQGVRRRRSERLKAP